MGGRGASFSGKAVVGASASLRSLSSESSRSLALSLPFSRPHASGQAHLSHSGSEAVLFRTAKSEVSLVC